MTFVNKKQAFFKISTHTEECGIAKKNGRFYLAFFVENFLHIEVFRTTTLRPLKPLRLCVKSFSSKLCPTGVCAARLKVVTVMSLTVPQE